MANDNYYPVEIRICSKSGWFTPQEAQSYYGRYSREGIVHHWWGDGTGASNHDNIVNYISNKALKGTGSANYVLSDNKITLMVSPDNVAWCSQAGNPTTISIEHQPTLGAEGYKKSGWLVSQLEERYGHRMTLYPHKHWAATSCPGTLDINRIRAEADKWHNGGYNPAPPPPPPVVVPPPPPPTTTVTITHSVLPAPVTYKLNKDANLWNYNVATWGEFKPVKALKKDEQFVVYAIADNHNVHAKYGVTQYSYSRGITNGVNMVDLDLVTAVPQPIPTPPPPAPIPSPTPPPPVPQEPDRNAIMAFLAMLAKLITDFLAKFRKV